MAKSKELEKKQKKTTETQKSALIWQCDLVANSQSTGQITVGSPIHMHCEGTKTIFNSNKLEILLNKKQKYVLHLLKVENISETEMDLIVTSYQAGQHQLKNFQLSDGNDFVDSGPLQFNVTSVLKKEAKPFGPFGPIGLERPTWYWTSIGVIVGLITIVALLKFRKSWQRKKIIKRLESHGTALSAYNQLNKELRSLDRELTLQRQRVSDTEQLERTHREHIRELEKSFRMYLVRELKVPAMEWSNKQILGEIKRTDKKLFKSQNASIEKLLLEFKRLNKTNEEFTLSDCQQMRRLCRDCCDLLYKERN